MAYSINPNLPKARAIAMKLLIAEGVPSAIVANRCGVHRSTIYRWKTKWLKLNEDIQLENVNRPTRTSGKQFRLTSCKWTIPTSSAKPHHSPNAIAEDIVDLVLELRRTLKRCAEVVWHYLIHDSKIIISLSSVRRILKRHFAINGRKKRVRYDNPKRPVVARPGELVQTDTIHYVCPITKRRRYVYTVIDLYTRMTYAEAHDRILPGIAASVIMRAQEAVGFCFSMVQADNGTEYSSYFEKRLRQRNITVRHSRLGRPNDNAHIERFNRTIQEEALGSYSSYRTSTKEIQDKITKYIEYYNTQRVHLGIQLQTPIQMLQSS